LVASSACKLGAVTLETLKMQLVPDEEACTLKPLKHGRGPMPFAVDENPLVSTDLHVIRFLSLWMLIPMTSQVELESYDIASLERVFLPETPSTLPKVNLQDPVRQSIPGSRL
jgi:hypothetical protein